MWDLMDSYGHNGFICVSSKWQDLIDIFYDTSLNIYDTLTIINHEFKEHIPDIYTA